MDNIDNLNQYSGTNEKGNFSLPYFSKFIDVISLKTAKWLGFKNDLQIKQESAFYENRPIALNRVDKRNLFSLIAGIIFYIFLAILIRYQLKCQPILLPYNLKIILKIALVLLLLLRYVNIVTWLMRPLFVESRAKQKNKVISFERSLFYAFFHYLEFVIYFAIIYLAFHGQIDYGKAGYDSFGPLYFSCITQLTVGYGDLSPQGAIRFVAALQAATGLLIVALTVGSLIPQIHFSRTNDNG